MSAAEPFISISDMIPESSYWNCVSFGDLRPHMSESYLQPKLRCAAGTTSMSRLHNQVKELGTSKGQWCIENIPINDTLKVLTSPCDNRESWNMRDREPRQLTWTKSLFF